MEASSDRKERWQRMFLTEDAAFASGELSTAATCVLFKLLEKPEGKQSSLANLMLV
jgi:hypothetical protein